MVYGDRGFVPLGSYDVNFTLPETRLMADIYMPACSKYFTFMSVKDFIKYDHLCLNEERT